jgi:hypothetical protein
MGPPVMALLNRSKTMQRREFLMGVGALTLTGWAGAQEQGAALRGPDVIFVPTPNEIVNTMLKLAGVSKKDTVYDLGCGAQKYGARGVGIDIDPDRVAEATDNVSKAGVADRVKIVRGDLFQANISEATVVTLYLLTDLNLKLRPKLLKELNPGTRIVSHAFSMGDWKPERTVEVSGTNVYLWRVPARKS